MGNTLCCVGNADVRKEDCDASCTKRHFVNEEPDKSRGAPGAGCCGGGKQVASGGSTIVTVDDRPARATSVVRFVDEENVYARRDNVRKGTGFVRLEQVPDIEEDDEEEEEREGDNGT